MRAAFCLIFSFFIATGNTFAQDTTIDSKLLRLKGLPLIADKSSIVKTYGRPLKVDQPNYECGFYSHDSIQYFQLWYKHLNFIGNDEEKYILENIKFHLNSSLSLEYGHWKLNSKLTKTAFVQIFGISELDSFTDRKNGVTEILMFFNNSDDGMIFSFKDDHLIEATYWSPC
ncbi:hypothetical protein [Rufibacter roseus]|uniref:Secreted protein n=1 Tax=Rufibacter roseus TaxID=1567108 RepID=A0ABW2DGB5_9BACT|nr:hypothetical protein [Rufibacter roseus]